MLNSNDIKVLVDVRHYPGSRYCPQFNKDRLKKSLTKTKIRYVHMEELGGRRRPDKNSELNAGWKSPQFRGYADYMQTSDFKEALKKLMVLAKSKRTAIMCAEALPWRCHRSLIADSLLVRGFSVQDIFTPTVTKSHKLTPFAHIYRKKITYPRYQE